MQLLKVVLTPKQLILEVWITLLTKTLVQILFLPI